VLVRVEFVAVNTVDIATVDEVASDSLSEPDSVGWSLESEWKKQEWNAWNASIAGNVPIVEILENAQSVGTVASIDDHEANWERIGMEEDGDRPLSLIGTVHCCSRTVPLARDSGTREW